MAQGPRSGQEVSRRTLGLGAAALLVSGSVLASRLLGLLRETILAAVLGVSSEGDLYRDAFVIPDLLNYLLAGGFLSITLIPILARRIEAGDNQGLARDFGVVFRWAAGSILALTAVMLSLAEPAARLIFPRLDEEAIVTVARLTRIALPAQVFFVLGGLLMAYQYAHRRFLYPVLAPVLYNVAIIAGGLMGTTGGVASPDGFVWGALVGAALGSFGLQWWGAMAAGWRPARGRSGTRRLGPGRSMTGRSSTQPSDPARSRGVMREYLALAFPLMVGQSVTVLDEQFPRLFGQLAGEGGTAALSLARMLNMLPVGIIAQAAGVASFPFLARLVAGGRNLEADQTTAKALRTTVALAVGATAVLSAASEPLVRIVFQWGVFNAGDSDTVAGLLPLFAASIPAWAIHQVVSRWFYAHRRMWLPVITGTVATLVAIPAGLLLFDLQGLQGIAIASTLVMWAYTISLTISWKRGNRNHEARYLGTFVRLGLAGAIAGVSGRFLADVLFDGSLGRALVAAAAVTLLVIVLFYGLAVLFGLRHLLPRRSKRNPDL